MSSIAPNEHKIKRGEGGPTAGARSSSGAVGSGALRLERLGNKSGDYKRNLHDQGATLTEAERKEQRRVLRGSDYYRVIQSLRALGGEYFEQADDMKLCGRLGVHECADCATLAARRVYTCKHRLCPYCLKTRAYRIARKLVEVVESFKNPVVMVLTIKNRDTLEAGDAHLRSSFQKLRDRVAFKRAFAGGVAFWETTHNVHTGWHVHLHCIVDGFMPKQQLSDLWLSCTGDSFIVDLSYIKPEGRREAIVEACKYPCKLTSVIHSPALVLEYLAATRARRLYWTWGSAYAFQGALEEAEDAAEAEPSEACPACGSIGSMAPIKGDVGRTWAITECVPMRGGWWVRAPDST